MPLTPILAVPEPQPSSPARRRPREAKPGQPPAHLSTSSKRWFKAIVSEYDLEGHHLRLLALACEAFDRGQEARAIVDAEGCIAFDRFGQSRPHPAVAIERDARTAAARLIRELGLDDSPEPDPRPPRRAG